MEIFNNREGWSVGGKGGVRHFHWQNLCQEEKIKFKAITNT